MGCFNSKPQTPALSTSSNTSKKEYSWDKARKENDASNYIISKRTGEMIVRQPDSINGQQFVIEECTDCDIYLCDNTATVSIDVCTNCRIFVGPVEGSIFFRNCKDLKCIIACQQFRTRDCENCDFLLYCMTQPIIETSANMRFGCFEFFYPSLRDQFQRSKLNPWINQWDNVYDFSPAGGNWSLLPLNPTPSELKFKALPDHELKGDALKDGADHIVVPKAWGGRPKSSDKSILVLFFGGQRDQAARNFINNFIEQTTVCSLIRTKEASLTASQAQTISANKPTVQQAIGQQPVVGMEVSGEDVLAQVAAHLQALPTETRAFCHFSEDYAAARQDISAFLDHLSLEFKS